MAFANRLSWMGFCDRNLKYKTIILSLSMSIAVGLLRKKQEQTTLGWILISFDPTAWRVSRHEAPQGNVNAPHAISDGFGNNTMLKDYLSDFLSYSKMANFSHTGPRQGNVFSLYCSRLMLSFIVNKNKAQNHDKIQGNFYHTKKQACLREISYTYFWARWKSHLE